MTALERLALAAGKATGTGSDTPAAASTAAASEVNLDFLVTGHGVRGPGEKLTKRGGPPPDSTDGSWTQPGRESIYRRGWKTTAG